MKKLIATIACFFLVFAFAGSALAATLNFSANGVTTTFISTSSMTKTSSNTWSNYSVRLSSLSYTKTPSYSYAWARPQGTDGTLYATKNKVNIANSRSFTPNSSGTTSNTVKVKVYNTAYEEYNVTDNAMNVAGVMTGTLS